MKSGWRWSAVMLAMVTLSPASLQHGAAQQKARPEAHRHSIEGKDRTDLNSATREELLQVPGMTRTWAERILRYRPYRTKKDLLDHGIVSPVVYARIKDFVIVHRAKQ